MIALPSYIDPEAWQAMLDMRKAKKVPTTAYAEKLLLVQLQRFKDAGHDPCAVMEQSIVKGWTDFWAPTEKDLKPVKRAESTDDYLARTAAESALDRARVSRPPASLGALVDKMRAK